MKYQRWAYTIFLSCFLLGCASNPAPKSNNQSSSNENRRVMSHSLLKSDISESKAESIFVLIEPGNNGWKVISTHDGQPKRAQPNQEILQTTADFKLWTTALDGRQTVCRTKKPFDYRDSYNACTSKLSTRVRSFALLSANRDNDSMYENSLELHRDAMNALSQAELNQAIQALEVKRQAFAVWQKERQRLNAEAMENQRIFNAAAQKAKEKERDAAEKSILLRASKAERGSEDRCTRQNINPLYMVLDPDLADVRCSFHGFMRTEQFERAGWIIINKDRTIDGLVTAYIIRKVR